MFFSQKSFFQAVQLDNPLSCIYLQMVFVWNFAEIWKKSKVPLWCHHGIIKTSSWCFVNGKCHDDVLMMPWWHHNGTFDFYKKNYILESMIMASWWRDEGIMLASWKNFIWRHFQKCHYNVIKTVLKNFIGGIFKNAIMMPSWRLHDAFREDIFKAL